MKPRYVEGLGHGLQVVQPPGIVRGARVYAFALPCDPKAVQRLVDRNLTEPSGVRFKVLGRRVFLSFLRGRELSSLAQDLGSLPDEEAAFWVPLRREGALLPEYWMPYVVVDQSIAMATGREVWGFNKEMGQLRVPTGPRDRAVFTARATLFAQPGARGSLEKLVEVQREGRLGRLSTPWEGRVLAGLADELFEFGVEGKEVPMVNLKQFRDAEDPTRACYQALVRNVCRVTEMRGAGKLVGPWRVSVAESFSHQVVQDLGLPGHALRTDTAVWADFDFTVEKGELLWEA